MQAEEDAVAVGHQDLPQAIQLLAEMGESADKVSSLVDSMLARVKRGEISTAKVSNLSPKLFLRKCEHIFIKILTFAGLKLLRSEVSYVAKLFDQLILRRPEKKLRGYNLQRP